MRRIVHKVDMAGRKAGLKLNAKKTKVMHIKRNNRENHTFKVDNLPLENVEQGHTKINFSIKLIPSLMTVYNYNNKYNSTTKEKLP